MLDNASSFLPGSGATNGSSAGAIRLPISSTMSVMSWSRASFSLPRQPDTPAFAPEGHRGAEANSARQSRCSTFSFSWGPVAAVGRHHPEDKKPTTSNIAAAIGVALRLSGNAVRPSTGVMIGHHPFREDESADWRSFRNVTRVNSWVRHQPLRVFSGRAQIAIAILNGSGCC